MWVLAESGLSRPNNLWTACAHAILSIALFGLHTILPHCIRKLPLRYTTFSVWVYGREPSIRHTSAQQFYWSIVKDSDWNFQQPDCHGEQSARLLIRQYWCHRFTRLCALQYREVTRQHIWCRPTSASCHRRMQEILDVGSSQTGYAFCHNKREPSTHSNQLTPRVK